MGIIENRLHKIKGQLDGIEKMIVEKRECPQILQQISAVRAALGQIALELLKDETKCMMKLKSEKEIDIMNRLLKSIYKYS